MAIRPSFRPTVCCSTIYHIVKYSSASVSSDLKALYKSVIIIIIIIIIFQFYYYYCYYFFCNYFYYYYYFACYHAW